MGKIKVHELAKELELNSKDVVSYLQGKSLDVKSHMSSVEDDVANDVRSHFGKKAEPAKKAPETEVKAAEAAKPSQTPKTSEDGKKEEHKKKTIAAVYNPQFSKNPSIRNGQRKTMNGAGGERRPRPNGEHSGASAVGARRPNGPTGDNRVNMANRPLIKPKVQPTSVTNEEKRTQAINSETREQQEVKPVVTENRPQNTERRPKSNGERRPQNGERRPQGGDFRGERKPFNRDNRDGGERRPFNRDNRDGERKPFNRDNRDGGERNGQFDRRNNNGQNRSFQKNDDRNRGGQTSAPAAENGPKKDTRRATSKPQKNNNYGKKDPKNKENFFNLERQEKKKHNKQPKTQEEKNEIKTIIIPESLTIRELADKMKVQPAEIVKKLFLQGKVVTVNHDVDFETAEEIALEFNCICEQEVKVDVIEELLKEEEEDESLMSSRPPVVCVMGHVDHGKTSLLDAIRDTHVIDREAGGITQHIGASVVEINGQKITFLDTPGHEAFTAMRMRGASSTDIAILVVAADDGVMPQTVEAINHAKAAGVEIIVAINKIDKPSANIDKVKQELSEYELIPEDWGGSTIFCPVSAHTHEGIDNLLEMVLLTADVLELKANKNRLARGLVIEAKLDKGRGVVATLLVQKGTLHAGDPIACGSSYGKVRAMTTSSGQRVKEALPSTPVEIIGLNEAPMAGDTFMSFENEKESRTFAETFIAQHKENLVEETKSKMSLDDLFSQIQAGSLKELDIIVKADVQGSVEAVKTSLTKLSNDEVVVKVIHGGVGAISESDVVLASASNAIIIGFNVKPDAQAKATADREGVDVRLYKVIYNAIEDVEAAMKGMLDPIFEEQIIGHAEIRQIFKASGVGNIAGSYVLDGKFERGCSVRVFRDGEKIHEGPLASLKRFKDDVKEVKAGFECGFVFDGFSAIQEMDTVEAYKMVEVPR